MKNEKASDYQIQAKASDRSDRTVACAGADLEANLAQENDLMFQKNDDEQQEDGIVSLTELIEAVQSGDQSQIMAPDKPRPSIEALLEAVQQTKTQENFF